MKCCIVTHKVVKGDGQGRVNYEISREVIHRGYQLTLLASQVEPDLQDHPQVNWVNLQVSGLPTVLLRNLQFSRKSAQWLSQHHQEFNIVKVNGAITTAASDVNAVHFVHGAWMKVSKRLKPHQSQSGKLSYNLRDLYHQTYTWLNARWEKQAFRKARSVVAVSNQIKRELIDIGVDLEKIRVITNGVDLQEFAPGTISRHEWSLPEGVPLGLFAGDITTPRKNLETTLHALASLPDVHLAIAGGTDRSPYPQLAAELGIESRTHFLGLRRDIPSLMKAVDFFVFPSRYEPFGLVLLEAMASGLPVITAKTAGGAALVSQECGIVLDDPDDAAALAEAIDKVSNHPDLRQEMGKAARAQAEQHSCTMMAQQYLDLFEELSKV